MVVEGKGEKMGTIRIGKKKYPVDLVVFDKDGLLFESKPFWIGLAYARVSALRSYLTDEQLEKWLKFMSVDAVLQNGNLIISDIDPVGIIAVASPKEEITLTAGFLVEHTGMIWTKARDIAKKVFIESDKSMNLKESLTPRSGFPKIFQRLRKAGIPYGIATSDDQHRAIESINFFDNSHYLSFIVTPKEVTNGKPNPEMLYLIKKMTGVPLDRMMMVGDSYVDVKMAREAGAIGIGIPEIEPMAARMRGYANEVITSLDDIAIE